MISLSEGVSSLFSKLGRTIGRHPGYFLVLPLLVSCVSFTWYSTFSFVSDPEYLFSPLNGPSKEEKRIQEKYFPTSTSAFDPGRINQVGCMGRTLVRAKPGSGSGSTNLLRADALDELLELDRRIRNDVTISQGQQQWAFGDLCAKSQDECYPNNVLLIAHHGKMLEDGSLHLTYPIWFDHNTFKRVDFPFFTGGVNITSDNTIASIEVIALNYFLRCETEQEKMR